MALFADKPCCLPRSAVSAKHSGAIDEQATLAHTRPLAAENEVFTARQAWSEHHTGTGHTGTGQHTTQAQVTQAQVTQAQVQTLR